MKKKLALFMAAIMSLTVVPVSSVFGANTIDMLPLGQSANEKEGVYDGTWSGTGTLSTTGIAHFVDIILDEDVESGSQFRAELVGAEWSNIDDGYYKLYSVFDPGDAEDPTPVDKNGNPISETVYLAGRLSGIPTPADEAHFDFEVDATGNVTYVPAWGALTAIKGEGEALDYDTNTESLTRVQARVDELAAKYKTLVDENNVIAADIALIDDALAVLPTTAPIIPGNPYSDPVKYTKTSLGVLRAGKVTTWEAKYDQLEKLIDEIDALDDYYNDGDTVITIPTFTVDPVTPPSATSPTALNAIFSVANAGTGRNSENHERIVWSNIAYEGNDGISAEQGIAYVKKNSATRITVTIMADIEVPKTDDIVIRLPLPIEIGKNAEAVEFNITDGGGFLTKKNYLLVDTTGDGTVTTADEQVKGREIVTLEDIRIEEHTIGVLTGGAFELTAPAGYRFMNRLNQVKLDTDPDAHFDLGALHKDELDYDATGGVTTLVEHGAIAWTDDEDQTSLAIYIDPQYVTESETLTSAILVQGLVLEPLDNDDIIDGEELFMEISKYDESDENDSTDYAPIQEARDDAKETIFGAVGKEIEEMDVTNEEFKIGVSVDWGVTLTPEEVVTLEAGRWADDVDDDFHATAELTLIETEKGGWHADRTTDFILPEGVKIRGLEITEVDHLYQRAIRFAKANNRG